MLLLLVFHILLPPQPEVLERIAADPFTFAAPGGESQQELEARLASFVHRQLLPSLQWGGPPAVVVTHGLAIKWWVALFFNVTSYRPDA
jgi:broad specificity phosphatase PhoE